MRKNIKEADEILDLYFPILDYGFCALVDYLGSDESIERYARVSYGSGTRKVSDTRNLIRYLYRHHHSTPIESVELAFHIGMPIHVARQLVRHRTFSPINEYSGRYSVMPDICYSLEKENFTLQSKDNKQGRSDEQQLTQERYDDYTNEIKNLEKESFKLYHRMLNDNIAREIARMHLPLNTYTYWYCKMDLNNLFKLLKLRCDSHAQLEIRKYANVMAGMVKRVVPLAFEAWYDYSYISNNWTRLDKEFLLYLKENYNYNKFSQIKKCYEEEKNEYHKILEISNRELEEFWSKLEIPEKVNFDLDIRDAKPSSYFEELIKIHSF